MEEETIESTYANYKTKKKKVGRQLRLSCHCLVEITKSRSAYFLLYCQILPNIQLSWIERFYRAK